MKGKMTAKIWLLLLAGIIALGFVLGSAVRSVARA